MTGRRMVAAVAAAAAGLAMATLTGMSPPARAAASPAVSVRVVGNQLVDQAGAPIQLLGVDRSGTEYACSEGWGLFSGPSDAASVAAMAAWHINAVRVPLNEDCWLGINGVKAQYAGANYQSAIENYVTELHSYGLVAILDLHWNAPGTTLASGQQVMADADHSPAFWSSVATAFRSDPGVVFDLYNEPHDISWSCWRNGCTTSAGWQAAGMQSLLDAVRSTGATQPVMVAGLNWAGDLSGWLANEPVDPAKQLVASVHVYNFSACNNVSCWDSQYEPVAAQVPVVTGELGENDCGQSFIDSFMTWADAHGVSYLGWSWTTAGCSSFPSLISSYDGTPTAFGAGLQAHLAARATATSGTTATTPTTPTGGTPVGGTPTGGGASPAPPTTTSGTGVPPTSPPAARYRIVTSAGAVYSFGEASAGSLTGTALSEPVVGAAATHDSAGYWLVASDGGVFSFGDARFMGSTGGMRLAEPIVGMAATPDGGGYWLVASDGGVFSFGDARFMGSTGGIRLAQPVVGIAATPGGEGYRMAAADGGVFDFGAAPYAGSAAGSGAATVAITG